jgi:hypothetical protein
VKTLILDIESTPILAWVWNLRQEYIPPVNIVHPSGMLCWAAKWLGEPEVEWRGRKPDGHKRMIQRIWKLLDEADAVVHYNGKSFDVPRIQREFLKLDLLLTVRRQFKFDSNKLEEVADQLGIGRKVEHEGMRLWLKCMDGEASAWERMKKYNIGDVRLTEQAYTGKLRPWINNHPSHAAFSGKDVCTHCGSSRLIARGFAFLTTGRYQRFQCKDCNSWGRSTTRDPDAVAGIRGLV